MRTVCIIPARGGSKGIPRKNLIDFCGKPLIAWSIEQAKGFETYVTSDSDEILKVSEIYGAKPIKRPKELSTDTTTSEHALMHALLTIGDVDNVIFLQPTSPLRTKTDVKTALEGFVKNNYDSMFSMSVLDDYCIWQGGKSITYDYKNRGRRQERKPCYLENGSIYIFKSWVLAQGNRIGGVTGMYKMPFWQSYEIDTKDDIEICEYYFNRRIHE